MHVGPSYWYYSVVVGIEFKKGIFVNCDRACVAPNCYFLTKYSFLCKLDICTLIVKMLLLAILGIVWLVSLFKGQYRPDVYFLQDENDLHYYSSLSLTLGVHVSSSK